MKKRSLFSASAVHASSGNEEPGAVISISEIQGESHQRLDTGIDELNRVLGGGVVRRSVILVGGDPGIGKSTLLMQALGCMAEAGEKVLYVSGEESSEQLKLRAERVGIRADNFLVLVENELEAIIDKIVRSKQRWSSWTRFNQYSADLLKLRRAACRRSARLRAEFSSA